MEPLSWEQLADQLAPISEAELQRQRVEGPTNAQARLRLFGRPEAEVRVTLYRDHHAWCPYCQKVWLWLEEKRIPYRIRKVTMFCYGEKERWFKQLVPTGMLPALELDGHLITESDLILQALEESFGPLGEEGLQHPDVFALRQLERRLFRAWCQWLCYCEGEGPHTAPAEQHFIRMAGLVEEALQATDGPFFRPHFGTADVIFVPYLERMNASLAYYKGYGLRSQHPAIDRWFAALEQRSTYLGTQSDIHTHAHDLPPQMGCCLASGGAQQQHVARLIDQGPWPAADPAVVETRQPAPVGAAQEALGRMLRHRRRLLEVNPEGLLCGAAAAQALDQALRCALTNLLRSPADPAVAPPAGTAAGLRYWRDRISVPRDMSLHAARRMRIALESTAALAGDQQGPELPRQHRRDQNPVPFVQAA
ncbi:glutathione S-transferase family protein [Synechococcus sp. HK05]|uniref:glutathione S-transferase family protein n=1 Tax=Synechococcus sp. HK05 TaxID=2725975 RepID=UPI001C38BFF3|nr:glutathione S-transferase family protein [Synechococcus sp. HK05]MBV2351212.1 glutathione S-transferase family protein [Synechococcus sp. HK05]